MYANSLSEQAAATIAIYPIGQYEGSIKLTRRGRAVGLKRLRDLPSLLQSAVEAVNPVLIDSAIRPGAWSVKKLVHHIADSHLIAYSWMRLALTEEWPTVFAYDPKRLSDLNDAFLDPSISFAIIRGVHGRWVTMLEDLPEQTWTKRGYVHPETGECTLERALSLYSWHSSHHLAQIQQYVSLTKRRLAEVSVQSP
jgi:hypothetical protein